MNYVSITFRLPCGLFQVTPELFTLLAPSAGELEICLELVRAYTNNPPASKHAAADDVVAAIVDFTGMPATEVEYEEAPPLEPLPDGAID